MILFRAGPVDFPRSYLKRDGKGTGIKGNEKIGADLKARTKKLVTETSKYDILL